MDFVNKTHLQAGWTMGFAPDGRELIVVVVKGTFLIPRDHGPAELADEQVALVEADQFTGEPGVSAPLYETDYAHRKPMCDLVLNATAYAPAGKVVRKLGVGVRVGPVAKSFAVVGNRVWRKGVLGVHGTDAEPFDLMPISYDTAFGGVDERDDPGRTKTFLANPVGHGYVHYTERADGRVMPNTEELDAPVVDPSARYRPMSLGPIGRNWQPRVEHVGTYDQKWQEERKPFFPDDFDNLYFQAAPPDQQMPYPKGGEEVVLRNLTPDGQVSFTLPSISMPVWFLRHQSKDERVEAVIDTLVIEPDLGRFTMTWRAVVPMARSCFEVQQVIAGQMPEAWQRARKYGNKPYYRGLAELVRARRNRK